MVCCYFIPFMVFFVQFLRLSIIIISLIHLRSFIAHAVANILVCTAWGKTSHEHSNIKNRKKRKKKRNNNILILITRTTIYLYLSSAFAHKIDDTTVCRYVATASRHNLKIFRSANKNFLDEINKNYSIRNQFDCCIRMKMFKFPFNAQVIA